jgi:hypothetical protein
MGQPSKEYQMMDRSSTVQAQFRSFGRIFQDIAALSIVMVTVVLARIATSADSPGEPSNQNSRTDYL